MIGQGAVCATFSELFPWPDAVIEVQPDGSDAVETLHRLGADPERLATISRTNAQQALLRHDWAYRWKEILQVAGLEPAPAMQAREERLKEIAQAVASTELERVAV